MTRRPSGSSVYRTQAGARRQQRLRGENEPVGLKDEVKILTGGTDPAEKAHPEVVKVMQELDIDLSNHTPRLVSDEELADCTVVATMGCSTLELDGDVTVRDWALEDPHRQSVDDVRAIRDDIQERVATLFDEYGDNSAGGD